MNLRIRTRGYNREGCSSIVRWPWGAPSCKHEMLPTAYRNKKRMQINCILFFIEVTTRFELVIRELQSLALPLGYVTILNSNDSDGNRTRVTAVKGRCLDRLTTEPCINSDFAVERPEQGSNLQHRG